jgi:hypothetical protein
MARCSVSIPDHPSPPLMGPALVNAIQIRKFPNPAALPSAPARACVVSMLLGVIAAKPLQERTNRALAAISGRPPVLSR